MGCEQSITVDKEKKYHDKRKNRKKGEKIIGRVSSTMECFENVNLIE